MLEDQAQGNAVRPAPSRLARQLIGSKRLAELCDRTTDAIRKWDRSRAKGGLGGLIPTEFQPRILAEAQARGLPLCARDLIAEPN